IARHRLEALGYWPLPEDPETAVPPEPEAPAAPPAIAGEGAAEASAALAGRAEPAQVPDGPGVAPAGGEASPDSDAAPPQRSPAPVGAGAGFEAVGDEIDDEIREVFLEEFAEEIDNLDALLPPWREQPDDLERLRPIRRVFHTLKGSGRLVGARTLGEFSWKIESMLNRVLEGTRPASPAVVAMVNQAYDVLPELNAALRGNGTIQSDLLAMQDVAERVAAG